MTENPPEEPPKRRGLKKGCKRAPGTGRRTGSPNKMTRDLREMILGALSQAGGQAYLLKQSKENPQAFMALVARCLPKDINVTTTSLEQLLRQVSEVEKTQTIQ